MGPQAAVAIQYEVFLFDILYGIETQPDFSTRMEWRATE